MKTTIASLVALAIGLTIGIMLPEGKATATHDDPIHNVDLCLIVPADTNPTAAPRGEWSRLTMTGAYEISSVDVVWDNRPLTGDRITRRDLSAHTAAAPQCPVHRSVWGAALPE